MPRFVILFHETPPGSERQNHYDLLFEDGAVLKTWAVAELPCDRPDQPAQPLPDHRPLYLDYQGPISENRGTVRRVEAGTYEPQPNGDFVVDGAVHRGVLSFAEGRVRYRADD